MKFILFSDSEDRKGRVLSIFAETGREVISVKDTDLLFTAIEKSNFPIVLIDVKFSHFPAFRISKELKEKFSAKNMKIYLIMPSVEKDEGRKVLDLWLADGLIFYDELEDGLRKLFNQFPLTKRGNFKEKQFLALLLELKSRSFNGTLIVNNGQEEKAVYFDKGMPRYSITSRREEKIGEFLLRQGKLSAEALEESLEGVRTSGKRLGEILIEKGIIEKDDFRKILQNQMEEIIEGIFAWDEANYTLTTENIAVLEDVLIERGLDELIYEGIIKYAEVDDKISISCFPKLTMDYEEISAKYPLKEREKETIRLLDGSKNIESLSFESDCTLKEIQRLCYLLKETGALELLPSPVSDASKVVIGRIETQELRVEPPISDKTEILPESRGEEVGPPETTEVEEQRDEEGRPGESRYIIPSYRFYSKNSIITVSLVLIVSLSVGLIVKRRAENRLLNEKIMHSTELIKSDSLPALKNAAQILNDCMKKNVSNKLIILLAFAKVRLFELTNDSRYLDEAKSIIKLSTEKENGASELKPLIMLISMAEGDMVNAGKLLNEIGASQSPFALYSEARYTLESSGDTEGAKKVLSSITQQDMKVVKLELANAWSLSGNLDKLKEVLTDLKKEIPGHPDVIMLKGDEKYLEGNYNEAEALYRLSLDYRPGHFQTTIRLARTHLAMNQSESVVKELEPVIERTDIKTNCGKSARLYYARALQKLKQLEGAKELFLQLASVYPQDDSLKSDLESVEKMIIKKESAEKHKQETVADLLKTAKKLYNKGKYEKAIRIFERGLDRADDEFLYWYALTLEGAGNSNAALLQLKKAEGMNPENALVHKELGKLYKERGNDEESANHFKLYLKYLKK